jgi:chromate transporter
MAVARIVPGVNAVNLAVLIGYRVRGAAGAIAAVLGLLVGPGIGVVLLAMAYEAGAGTPALHAALKGAAAASAGLILAVAFQSGRQLLGRTRGQGAAGFAVIAAVTFLQAGPLGFPTLGVVLGFAPLGILIAFVMARGRRDRGRG